MFYLQKAEQESYLGKYWDKYLSSDIQISLTNL